MSDREIGPFGILAVLTGVGLFGGRTGHAVLRRLRRLVAWAVPLGVVFSVGAFFAIDTWRKEGVVFFGLGVASVIALCILWCMISFAIWLTRPEDSPYEHDDPPPRWAGQEPVEDLRAGRMPWYELLGVYPDDGREEIIAALEREARDGETWYEAINVSPDATRREIVHALRRGAFSICN